MVREENEYLNWQHPMGIYIHPLKFCYVASSWWVCVPGQDERKMLRVYIKSIFSQQGYSSCEKSSYLFWQSKQTPILGSSSIGCWTIILIITVNVFHTAKKKKVVNFTFFQENHLDRQDIHMTGTSSRVVFNMILSKNWRYFGILSMFKIQLD